MLHRPTSWLAPDAVAPRSAIVTLCVLLTVIGPHRWHNLPWLVGVAAVGGLAVLAVRMSSPLIAVAVAAMETAVIVAGILDTGSGMSPLLPALLSPVVAASLVAGLAPALVPLLAAVAGLAVGGVAGGHGNRYAVAVTAWIALAIAGMLAGDAGRRLRLRAAPLRVVDTSYAAANRLLAQLRPVARQLSVGLEPVTIAETLLHAVLGELPFDRGAVLVRTRGGRPVPLATHGLVRISWPVDIDVDSAFGEAWLSQRPSRVNRQYDGRPGSAVVIPLVMGVRTFGLIGLESDRERAFDRSDEVLLDYVAEGAMQLETALLFDEVRGVATTEERRRLAREIHDGIAQELTGVGYAMDGLLALAGDDDELAGQLAALRGEVSRLVGELRLSIFDLRSDIDVHGGLGAALSDYVRSVGRTSGMTVHLSLAESADRLPAVAEVELLRIAQEAITNARRHAGADNLWVTLAVDPPEALLRIEDDGRGLGDPRADSFGLGIMQERAKRLRTSLEVGPREPRGTAVQVQLHPATPDRATSVTRSNLTGHPRRP